jgi:hypothetical protein
MLSIQDIKNQKKTNDVLNRQTTVNS